MSGVGGPSSGEPASRTFDDPGWEETAGNKVAKRNEYTNISRD
jgi:hypothetical protein